jgi:signal transduction histidine kinase
MQRVTRRQVVQGVGAVGLAFTVADTGSGITAEQMEWLFEAFSQADVSTTRKYGGTGPGLAISRKFCQMMGDDITAASEYGKGSTFAIRLPADVHQPDAVPTLGSVIGQT